MRRYSSSNLSFIDLLFNVLVGFALLFILAFLLINPITKKSDAPKKAELMIYMEWPDAARSDIDIWVKKDNQRSVGFSNKEHGFIHLDRDDLGVTNDVTKSSETGLDMVNFTNREVITLRGIDPGKYYVAIKYYSDKDYDGDYEHGMDVHVVAIDLNPYKEFFDKKFYVSKAGEVFSIFAFELDAKGNVVKVFEHNEEVIPYHANFVPNG